MKRENLASYWIITYCALTKEDSAVLEIKGLSFSVKDEKGENKEIIHELNLKVEDNRLLVIT